MRTRTLLLATALAGAIVLPDLARAQDTPPPAAEDLGANEIVVTAQRREQRLQDVPVAVSVVSGAALQRGAIRTLEDMTSRLPNVRLAQVPGADLLNIRGVGSGINLGFEQSVATFVDGIYRSRSRASRLAFFDVDRVEVLKGPQTTFFGNNAIAGALNITTRGPGDHFEYDASALYSPSDDEYSVGGGVSIPVTDRFAVRVAAQASGMGGYIKNTRLDNDGPDLNDRIGRISLRWEPVDTIKIEGRVDHGRMRDKGVFNSELISCPPNPAATAPRGACARFVAAATAAGTTVDDRLDHRTDSGPSAFDLDYTEAMVKTGIELGRNLLTATTGYYDHDYHYNADVLPGGSNASVVGTVAGLPTSSSEKFHQFSQELRLESTGKRTIDYMIGAYYAHSKLEASVRSGFYFAPFGAFAPAYFKATDPIAVFFDGREKVDVLSVFGSTTVHATDRLRLNLGLRYSTVKKTAHRTSLLGISDDDLQDIIPGPAAGQAILLPVSGSDIGDFADPTRRDDKFMPAANLQYDLSDDLMTYVSYNKGFKAGGYSIGNSKASFGPETVDAFEGGIKSSFLDKRVTLNLALFLSKYKGLQESTFIINAVGTPVASIANAAKSTAKGVELGGEVRVTQGLRVTFDVARLSSRYNDYPLAPCTSLGNLTPGCTADLSGHVRPYAPKWSGNVGLSYNQPLTGDIEARLDGSVFFTSRYYEDVSGDPLSEQSGYAKIDARIGIGPRDRRWEVAVIGKNLNDRTTAQVRRPLPSAAGSYEALADRPRSIALQFSIRG